MTTSLQLCLPLCVAWLLIGTDGQDTTTGLKPPPSGTESLVSEANAAFLSNRYEEAEKKYAEVLKRDPENLVTLENLAAIQIGAGKLKEGEANVTSALALQTNDAFGLSLKGVVRFKQGRYSDALESLERSAKVDPNNAETQNYLGITLSQLGKQEQALAALRKAIALHRDYAVAHYNIAVVYATLTPPRFDLAKAHCDKARALGHSLSPELERLLSSVE